MFFHESGGPNTKLLVGGYYCPLRLTVLVKVRTVTHMHTLYVYAYGF